MSSEPDVFSVHVNGHVLQQSGHKVSSVGLISGSSATAGMKALYTGRWMLSSHTSRHLEGTWPRPRRRRLRPRTHVDLTHACLPSRPARLRGREDVRRLRSAAARDDV